LKKVIKYLYKDTKIGNLIIAPIKNWYDNHNYQKIPDEAYIKNKFKKKLGYRLNLDEPHTFNEKIQWLKLYDRTPLHTLCADKYRVREHVSKTIGSEYLIPLLYETDDASTLTKENLPEAPFVLKSNHDSGNVIIVNDKDEIDWKYVQRRFTQVLKSNYYYPSREWQYKDIKPRVIVEKMLIDKNNKIPNDYKLHCFNGKLLFTQIDSDRFEDHKRNLYNINWELMPCRLIYENDEPIEKPSTMDKMQELAEVIAKDFDYVRVDFYTIEDKIYFGEITFHPESGFGKFSSKGCDEELGALLKLNKSR